MRNRALNRACILGMLAVFVLAAAIRLWFAVEFDGLDIRVDKLDQDSPSYFEVAKRIAEDGDFMSVNFAVAGEPENVSPTAFRPPLWPLAQAAVYEFTGPIPTNGRVLAILLDAGACALIVLLGFRLHSLAAGVVGGMIAAAWPQFIVSTRQLMSESLFLLLLVATLLALESYGRNRTVRSGATLGVILGLATLARPNGWTLAAVVLLWLLWRDRLLLRDAVRPLVSVAVAVMVLVVPYVAYASARMHTFVPITTQAGTVLAGDFTDTVADRGHPYWGWWDIAPIIETRRLVDSEVEWDRESRKVALAWIQNHPRDTTTIIGYRFVRYFDLYWEYETRVKTKLSGDDRFLTGAVVVMWWPVAALSVVAVVWLRRKRLLEPWYPILLVAALFTVTGILFGGASRYRLPIEPGAILLASATITGLRGHRPVKAAS